MALEDRLDKKIKAVCPIHGISFGKLNDKTTWSIDFKEEATPEQRTAGLQVLNDFVYDATEQQREFKQKRVDELKTDPLYKLQFKQYKQSNPTATFGDFLDYLDTL